MKRIILLQGVVAAAVSSSTFAGPPALTIYNQNFAVVRDTVPLDLKQGVNEVRFSETTAHLEPDSVILRDSQGKTNLQILEQNYRNDPISQELLLSMFEGKTIDFLVTEPNKPNTIVQGRIIRSGYAMHSQSALNRYGPNYSAMQSSMAAAKPGPQLSDAAQLRGRKQNDRSRSETCAGFHPVWDAIRQDPRFIALIKKYGG